jgi:hypothetical protein
MAYLFYQLLPAFLSEHWHINDHLLSVVLWIKSDVSGEYRFFNLGNNTFFPGLDEELERASGVVNDETWFKGVIAP